MASARTRSNVLAERNNLSPASKPLAFNSTPDISWQKLSVFDDILTLVLLDNLYLKFSVHKMLVGPAMNICQKPKDYPVVTDEIAEIVRQLAAGMIPVNDAVDAVMKSVKWLQEWFNNQSQKDQVDFIDHARRYMRIYHSQAGFDITQTYRYGSFSDKAEASVVATRDWMPGDIIRHCNGYLLALTDEEDEELQKNRKDFSVLHSSRKNSTCLLLGPARFVNHQCNPNVQFIGVNKEEISFRVIRQINRGEEIVTSYGDDYFDEGNKNCFCQNCQDTNRGAFALVQTTDENQNLFSILGRKAKLTSALFKQQKEIESEEDAPPGNRRQHLLSLLRLEQERIPPKVFCQTCGTKQYAYTIDPDKGQVICNMCIRNELLFMKAWPERVHDSYIAKRKGLGMLYEPRVVEVPFDRLIVDGLQPVFVTPADDKDLWWPLGVIVNDLKEEPDHVVVRLFREPSKDISVHLDLLKPFHHRTDPFVTYALTRPGFLQDESTQACIRYVETGELPDYMNVSEICRFLQSVFRENTPSPGYECLFDEIVDRFAKRNLNDWKIELQQSRKRKIENCLDVELPESSRRKKSNKLVDYTLMIPLDVEVGRDAISHYVMDDEVKGKMVTNFHKRQLVWAKYEDEWYIGVLVPNEEAREAINKPNLEFEEGVYWVRYLADYRYGQHTVDELRVFSLDNEPYLTFKDDERLKKSKVFPEVLDILQRGLVPKKLLWTRWEQELRTTWPFKVHLTSTTDGDNEECNDDADSASRSEAPLSKVQKGDVVLVQAKDGEKYKAKIAQIDNNRKKFKYFIKYHRWSDSYNEWVERNKIFPYTG